MKKFNFETIDDKATISTFKAAQQNSLTFPNDSYREAQYESSQHR